MDKFLKYLKYSIFGNIIAWIIMFVLYLDFFNLYIETPISNLFGIGYMEGDKAMVIYIIKWFLLIWIVIFIGLMIFDLVKDKILLKS